MLEHLTSDTVRVFWSSSSFVEAAGEAADAPAYRPAESPADGPGDGPALQKTANGADDPPDPPLPPPEFVIEPFYGAKYADDAIPKDWLEAFQRPPIVRELQLPGHNPFVSTDFSLLNGIEYREVPDKVLEMEGLVMWHLAHVEFKEPRIVSRFSIR